MKNITRTDSKTIEDFGDQWTRYQENTGWYGSTDCLIDIIGPHNDIADFKEKYVADIGSGTGRIVNMLLDAGARKVFAIEPSDAFYVLKKNIDERRGQVEAIHSTGEAVGTLEDLDLVVSFGVLHHIVDPLPIVKEAYKGLRPGGKMIVWLYGKEGNELYLAIFGTIRTVTKHLPDWALSSLSFILNIFLDAYIYLCRFLPLPMREYMRNHMANLDRRIRKVTIFDQLNPAYAKYYRKDEAKELLEEAGFNDVQLYHRHGYSWTASGIKNNA